MAGPARRFDVHRLSVDEVRADPGRFGFESCDCQESPCPECGGLEVVRVPQPCVGCGHCCLAAPCHEALCRGTEPTERCRFLQWDGELYRCGLAEEAAASLDIGEGCCQPLNSWRREVRFRG